MIAAFTPGPWKVRTMRVIEAPYHRVCASGEVMDYGREVAWTQPYGDDETRLANAHLIAAAPCTHIAGEALLARVDQHAAELAEPLFLEEREALRVALAKARGEPS